MRAETRRAYAAREPDIIDIRSHGVWTAASGIAFLASIERLPVAAAVTLGAFATGSISSLVSRALALRRFSTWASTEGLFGLIVTSDSPKWSKHVHLEWLPRFSVHCSVLNWSEHTTWTSCPPVDTFLTFVKRPSDPVPREYSPVVLVPTGPLSLLIYRFYAAFLDAHHGNHAALLACEERLFHHYEAWLLAQPDETHR